MGFSTAKLLFRIDGVRGVFFAGDFITVSKQEDADWTIMKPEIFAVIMDFFASGLPIVTQAANNPDAGKRIIGNLTTFTQIELSKKGNDANDDNSNNN